MTSPSKPTGSLFRRILTWLKREGVPAPGTEYIVGLDTRETYLGLLWDRGDLAASLGIGFLDTNYDALSTDNSFFGELYRDRDWLSLRAATSLRF